MSWSRQTTIWCDGCEKWDQAGGTVRQLRRDLKRRGWRYLGGGLNTDLCPECAKKVREVTCESTSRDH